MDQKPRRRRLRFGLISLFALIAAVGVLACFWNPFDRRPSKANLHLIEYGMTIDEVTLLVGPPDDTATDSKMRIYHAYQIPPDKSWQVRFAVGKVESFVGVTHPTMAGVRRQTVSPQRTGRDGRTINTASQ